MSENASTVEFREIPEWPGYRVGNDGSIWCCRGRGHLRGAITNEWRPLKQKTDRYGYSQVTLRIIGRKKSRTVHQLVLESFVGQCPEGLQCRHLDGNSRNNHLANLCWGTPVENSEDRNQHGHTQRGSSHYRAKLTEDEVREILASTASNRSLAQQYSVSDVMVGLIRRRRSWTHVS